MKHFLLILPLAILITACGSNVTPEKKTIGETRFTTAYAKSYGAHYASRGIAQNVIDFDLYSANIDLDSTHHIVGTGSNLYISDIFVPTAETTLQPESYRSDTTGSDYTFLPGVDYEGNISGAYLLRINDGSLSGYTVFNDGTFTLTQDGDTTQVLFTLHYTEGNNIQRTYEAEFRGIIVYE